MRRPLAKEVAINTMEAQAAAEKAEKAHASAVAAVEAKGSGHRGSVNPHLAFTESPSHGRQPLRDLWLQTRCTTESEPRNPLSWCTQTLA